MPYTVLCFQTRKPDLSPQEFAKHYEDIHIPLIKEIVGDAFPESHLRYYIKRAAPTEGASPDDIAPPLIFFGSPEEVDYDCVFIMEFEDFEAFGRMQAAFELSPRKEEIHEDEERFIVRSKLRAIAMEDVRITLR